MLPDTISSCPGACSTSSSSSESSSTSEEGTAPDADGPPTDGAGALTAAVAVCRGMAVAPVVTDVIVGYGI